MKTNKSAVYQITTWPRGGPKKSFLYLDNIAQFLFYQADMTTIENKMCFLCPLNKGITKKIILVFHELQT